MRGRDAHNESRREETRKAAEVASQSTMVDTASRWEREWKASDPDYAVKLEAVEGAILKLIAKEGPPKDAAGVVEMSKRALDSVNAMFRKVTPKPQATDTPNSASNAQRTERKPKTTLDIIDQVIVAA
jgi:hypothetical protein